MKQICSTSLHRFILMALTSVCAAPLSAQTTSICQTPHVYWWAERTPPQVSAYSIRQASTENDKLSDVGQKQRYDLIERSNRFLKAFMSWDLFWDDAGGDLSDAQWQQRFGAFVAGTRAQWLDQVPQIGGIDEDTVVRKTLLKETAKQKISTGIHQLCPDLAVDSVVRQGNEWIVTYQGTLGAVQMFCLDKKLKEPGKNEDDNGYHLAQLKSVRWDRSVRNKRYDIQVRLNDALQVIAVDSLDHTPFQIGNGYLLKDQKKQSFELFCMPTSKAFD